MVVNRPSACFLGKSPQLASYTPFVASSALPQRTMLTSPSPNHPCSVWAQLLLDLIPHDITGMRSISLTHALPTDALVAVFCAPLEHLQFSLASYFPSKSNSHSALEPYLVSPIYSFVFEGFVQLLQPFSDIAYGTVHFIMIDSVFNSFRMPANQPKKAEPRIAFL